MDTFFFFFLYDVSAGVNSETYHFFCTLRPDNGLCCLYLNMFLYRKILCTPVICRRKLIMKLNKWWLLIDECHICSRWTLLLLINKILIVIHKKEFTFITVPASRACSEVGFLPYPPPLELIMLWVWDSRTMIGAHLVPKLKW